MEKYNVKNSNKMFLWVLLLPQVLAIILIGIFSLFIKDLEVLQNSLVYIISMTLLAQASFFIIYFIFARKNNIKISNEIKKGIKSLSIKNVLFCALISIICVFGLIYFVGIFDKILFELGYRPGATVGLRNDTFGWFLLNVLFSAVFPAIMEELIFRGVIFKGLKKRGFWFSAVVSSIMFMIVHLSLSSLIYPIIMGIIFCLVVRKTGSIIYSMIVHFCNNFIVLFVEYLGNVNGGSLLPDMNLWWQYVLAIIVAFASIVFVWLIITNYLKKSSVKNCEFNSEENNYIKNNKNENIILNNLNKNKDITETDFKQIEEEVYKKNDFISTTYTVIIGFIFWLIMIIISL